MERWRQQPLPILQCLDPGRGKYVDPVGPLAPDVPDEAAVVVVAAEVLVEVLADLVPGRIDGGITTGGNGSGSSGPDLAGISAANFLSIFGCAAA